MDKTLKQMLITVIILFLSLFIIRFLFMIFAPFIIGLILANLIEPMVQKAQEILPGSRTVAVLSVLVLIVAIVALLLVLGVSRFYVEVNEIIRSLPEYEALTEQFQTERGLRGIMESLELSETIINTVEENIQVIFDTIRSGLLEAANFALNALSQLPLALMILFLSFVATFYISRDKERINNIIYKLFPEKWEDKVTSFKNELAGSAIGYIKAQLILISISGFITGIGLFILGSEYALSLAILAAILDLIPIIGPALIIYPWAVVSLLMGRIGFALGLVAIHLILTGVRSSAEGHVIGGNIGIHPLATLMSLFVGFRVLGVIGFLVGPVLLVLIKTSARAGLIPFWEAE